MVFLTLVRDILNQRLTKTSHIYCYEEYLFCPFSHCRRIGDCLKLSYLCGERNFLGEKKALHKFVLLRRWMPTNSRKITPENSSQAIIVSVRIMAPEDKEKKRKGKKLMVLNDTWFADDIIVNSCHNCSSRCSATKEDQKLQISA